MNITARCTLAASLTLFAGLASALTADGGEETPCDFETQECGPGPTTPPQPSLPTGVAGYGLWRLTSPNADTLEGGLNGIHQTYVFGGGAGSYYNGALEYANLGSASSMSFQVQTAPIASVGVSATGNALGGAFDTGHASASMSLTYRVVVRAADAASALAIDNLISTSGAIASISGSYSLAGGNFGYGDVSASTGANELDPSLDGTFYAACGSYGVATTRNTAGCGHGTFNLPVNFVDGSTYSDGNPLDFVSLVSLSADAQTGYNDYDGSIDPGSMTAFIDPTITLAAGIDGQLILGDSNDVVSNASEVSAVPEPSQGALLLAGLGFLGPLLRRHGKSTNFAS